MQLIPVIDLLNGKVVHAKKGDRKNYQPIQSLISSSSKPLDIVDALLAYYPFKQLYIADLNSIQKTDGNNLQLIKSIAQHYPDLKLWIDAGISSTSELAFWNDSNFNVILGSENFSGLDIFLEVKNQLDADFILSLDFMPDGYKGPTELLRNTNYWPQDVILMSLTHVGANQGFNTGLINNFQAYVHSHKLYAAGGIRNADDLATLKHAGISGALIASALHSRQISIEDIKNISQ